jgi:hypothetical protein
MHEDQRPNFIGLLAGLGFTTARERCRIEEAVKGVLQKKRLWAAVEGIRYGVVTLSCDQITAMLLRYDTELLLQEINNVAPGVIKSVRIRVKSRKA